MELWGLATFGLLGTIWLRQARNRTLCWLLCCFTFFAGYQQYYIASVVHKAQKIAELKSKSIETEIKIIALRRMLDSTAVIATANLSAYQLGTVKLNLNWQLEQQPLAQQPQLGEIWRVKLKLKPLSSRLNHGGFNRQRWLLSQNILATATLKQGELIQRQYHWRQQKLDQVLQQTENLPYRGIILALAFGERAWMTQEHWNLFRESGTAHLIAISGLHIGLVAGLVWGIARLGQFFLKVRYISYHLPHLIALLAAIFYAYLADFLLPTQRALWAYCFWLILTFCRVYLPPWKLLLLIVAWLSLLDPLSVLSESFWLSCGTVALLCFYYHYFPLSRLQWRGQKLKQQLPIPLYWLCGLIHLQLGLLLLFTPLQLLIFQGLPSGTLCSNILLVPLFSFVVIPLILFNLCSGGITWHWVDWLLKQALTLLEILPNHYLPLSDFKQLIVIAVCLTVLIFLLLYRTFNRTFSHDNKKQQMQKSIRRALLLVIILLMVCLSVVAYKRITKPDWRLEMLDVGQGLAMLIIHEQRATVFDTGQAWQGSSMAELEILPYLQRQGLTLEQVIISHDDNDHAGGAAILLQNYPTAVLVNSSQIGYGAQQRKACLQGERWQWQGFQFEVLSPNTMKPIAKNRDSCVLLVSRDKVRFVLSGDVHSETENRIAAEIGKIDWLQVAHHGSKTSSGWRWLATLQPQISLISSGLYNQWNLPHPDIVDRLQHVQSAVYNTALDGQISLQVKNGSWKIDTARNGLSPWYQIIIGLEKEMQLE